MLQCVCEREREGKREKDKDSKYISEGKREREMKRGKKSERPTYSRRPLCAVFPALCVDYNRYFPRTCLWTVITMTSPHYYDGLCTFDRPLQQEVARYRANDPVASRANRRPILCFSFYLFFFCVIFFFFHFFSHYYCSLGVQSSLLN